MRLAVVGAGTGAAIPQDEHLQISFTPSKVNSLVLVVEELSKSAISAITDGFNQDARTSAGQCGTSCGRATIR